MILLMAMKQLNMEATIDIPMFSPFIAAVPDCQ